MKLSALIHTNAIDELMLLTITTNRTKAFSLWFVTLLHFYFYNIVWAEKPQRLLSMLELQPFC